MKRTDIRAGVVYAIKSSYGPPSPIVFLEDGAAGLYSRGAYGDSKIRKLEEDSYTKARRGKGFSDSTRGYAAIREATGRGTEGIDALRALDPAAELARFAANDKPSNEALYFTIEPSLSQIGGPYDEELAAYETRRQAEREAGQRARAENEAARDRADAITDALSAFGVDAEAVSKDRQNWSHICISAADAEKLIALLRGREA